MPLVDVTIPFTGRPKVWDRAYQTLTDTVAAFTAVASVQSATVTDFGRSLHRHNRHEHDELQHDGSHEAGREPVDGLANDPRPGEWS